MTERLKPLRGEGAKLLKMVLEAQDLQTLEQALELGTALGQPAEGLLDGIEATGAGTLSLSSRFQGTQAQRPALDTLLIHQLAMALPDSREAALRESVRKLTLSCRVLPLLRGFTALETLEITLLPGTQWPDLSSWGELPTLLELKITGGGTKEQPAGLASLSGLQAPSLQVASLKGLGLTSIDGLAATTDLRWLDVSGNPQLKSIRALAKSAPNLETLNFEECSALASLDGLQGSSALCTLRLEGCSTIRSLQPLSDSRALTTITLQECEHLASLEGLCGPQVVMAERSSYFSLRGCASLTSLRGLPPLAPSVTSLDLGDTRALQSLEGIEAASRIERLEIENACITSLAPLACMTALKRLQVSKCAALVDVQVLGQLPQLADVGIGAPKLARLPDRWGDGLNGLHIGTGSFSALGKMPRSLETLEVRGVPSLRSLHGVESAASLSQVAIDTALQDASALQGLAQAHVACYPQRSAPVTPQWLMATFGDLKPLRLDLSASGLKDLQFLVDLPNLQWIRISEQAAAAYGVSETGFHTDTDARKLQRAVCKKHQIPTPEHLKMRRTANQVAVEGGPNLVDIKRGLTSTEFSDVVAAVQALRTSGSPALYDAVVQGVHAPSLYNGATESLGRMFREIKAGYRAWARWALTHILMDAPDSASAAVALRNAIETIELEVSLVQHQDPSRVLPLSRFRLLKSLTLARTGDTELSSLRDAGPSLQTLVIRGLSQLTTLESLAGMKAIESLRTLRLEDCEGLVSLKGLEGAACLEHLLVKGGQHLKDFSAMAHLHSLQTFSERGLWRDTGLEFERFAPLSDIGFAAGLHAARSIELRLRGSVDLTPLAGLPNLQALRLNVDCLDQDFSPLAGVTELEVSLVDHSTTSSVKLGNPVKPEYRHAWDYEFPRLAKLRLINGEHDLQKLRAPALQKFQGDCHLPSLRGVGHVPEINFSVYDCASLEGLAGSPAQSLNLQLHDNQKFQKLDLAVLREMPQLRTLRLGQTLTPRQTEQITGCAQVQALQARQFSGSLAFLAGWTALTEIDMRDAGELTDLETLCDLPALAHVYLRGAATKREAWPKALQDRLDFRTS